MPGVVEDLWTSGSTQTISQGKAVVYGTLNADVLTGAAKIEASGSHLKDYISAGVVLVGGDGRDRISGTQSNDVLIGGTGDDTLQGGTGNDVYVYKTGDGRDTISGDDNDGTITINGMTLGGAGSKAYLTIQGRPAWRWTGNSRTYSYVLVDGNIATGGTLQITGDGIAAGDYIAIANFKPGDLGLNVASVPKVVFQTDSNTTNHYVDPDYVAPTPTVTMDEGHSTTTTVALNAPALAGQKLRVGADGGVPNLSVSFGGELQSLESGPVDITLQEGQTLVTLLLVSTGDIDSNRLAQLTARSSCSGVCKRRWNSRRNQHAAGNRSLIARQQWRTQCDPSAARSML
jgi:Ca2+-binding RTX toxin-like protein